MTFFYSHNSVALVPFVLNEDLKVASISSRTVSAPQGPRPRQSAATLSHIAPVSLCCNQADRIYSSALTLRRREEDFCATSLLVTLVAELSTGLQHLKKSLLCQKINYRLLWQPSFRIPCSHLL